MTDSALLDQPRAITQVEIDQRVFDLYDEYCHGRMDRREFLLRAAAVTAGGLAMAQALMPRYAAAQTISFTDSRIRAQYVNYPSPGGNSGQMRGYLVQPAGKGPFPVVLVIHENRGLNPHTEDVARRFALANFMAFAPDTLTSVGGYPGDDYRGGQLFASLDRAKMTRDLVAAARWLKARPDCNDRIAATGFCFGGAQSNALAGLLGPDLAAAAPFYGGATPVADVPNIKAAILIHHGALDSRLVADYPAQIAELQKHDIRHEGHLWPDSVHGFFNDATPERYNEVTAKQAWVRTLEWFNEHTRTAPAAT